MPGIDHAPRHGRRAWSMGGHETRRVRGRVAVEHVVDGALTIERDVLGFVPGDLGVAHLPKQGFELRWLRMREFDELEAVGAGGIGGADRRGRCVVRKWAHRRFLRRRSGYGDKRAQSLQSVPRGAIICMFQS